MDHVILEKECRMRRFKPFCFVLVGLFLLVFEVFYLHIPLTSQTRFFAQPSLAQSVIIFLIAVVLIVIGITKEFLKRRRK